MPLSEAAERLNASESTIRRKIKRGDLRAKQEETIQGYRWLVEVADEQVATTGDKVVTSDAQVVTTPHSSSKEQATPSERDDRVVTSGEQVRTLDAQVPTTELFQELRRLHDQNVQLAGQVGFLQAQLQQAQEQVKLLTDTQHAPAPPAQPESTPQPAEQPAKRLPWWKRWFAEI